MTDTQTEIREGVVVRPGDIFVVRVDDASDQDAAELRTRLQERLPSVDVLVIGGADQIGVIRDGITKP